jgi:hypothetical protein
MNESIAETQRLLQQIIAHLDAGTRTDTRQAAAKWARIAAIASTRTPSRPVEFPHPTTVLVPVKPTSPRAKGTPKATHIPGKGVDRDCVPGPY